LFQAAGIKKKDLENPETAKFIYETVGNAMAQQGRTPPPAPPGMGGGGMQQRPGQPGYVCLIFCWYFVFDILF
jgi:hypothetical protein